MSVDHRAVAWEVWSLWAYKTTTKRKAFQLLDSLSRWDLALVMVELHNERGNDSISFPALKEAIHKRADADRKRKAEHNIE